MDYKRKRLSVPNYIEPLIPVRESNRPRRVDPDRLAARLPEGLVKEMDGYVAIPGALMPSFAIRKDLQVRYQVDRRPIYDYLHSRGLRVSKEDKVNNLSKAARAARPPSFKSASAPKARRRRSPSLSFSDTDSDSSLPLSTVIKKTATARLPLSTPVPSPPEVTAPFVPATPILQISATPEPSNQLIHKENTALTPAMTPFRGLQHDQRHAVSPFIFENPNLVPYSPMIPLGDRPMSLDDRNRLYAFFSDTLTATQNTDDWMKGQTYTYNHCQSPVQASSFSSPTIRLSEIEGYLDLSPDAAFTRLIDSALVCEPVAEGSSLLEAFSLSPSPVIF